MSALLQADHYFLLLVHFLIIIFLLSHITLVFMNILYVSILDGHNDVCTCVAIINHISDGLRWLHAFVLTLILYKFGRKLSFIIGWTRISSVLTPFHLLLQWMNMYVYAFFLPNISSFVSLLDSTTSFLDATSYIFATNITNRKLDILFAMIRILICKYVVQYIHMSYICILGSYITLQVANFLQTALEFNGFYYIKIIIYLIMCCMRPESENKTGDEITTNNNTNAKS